AGTGFFHRPLRGAVRGTFRDRRPRASAPRATRYRRASRGGHEVSERGSDREAESFGAPSPALSIIVPLYNEEANVEPLWSALEHALAPAGLDYEVLLVDDGSTDGTFEAAAALARSHREVRVVKLRRNYGQTPAMAAGMEQARGEVLVTM